MGKTYAISCDLTSAVGYVGYCDRLELVEGGAYSFGPNNEGSEKPRFLKKPNPLGF